MSSNDSIAMFLPAHNEAENLPHVANAAIEYLESRECPYALIIVDDGSNDDTTKVTASLAKRHCRLEVVRHDENQGYGAALRSGFGAALETSYSWIAFCDADRQFHPADVDHLIVAAEDALADGAIGFRFKRADGIHRRIMGRGWDHISQTALGFKARDVDCGFKSFRRYVVARILPELVGSHATVSPELLARLRRHQFHIVEVGVEHYPRGAGEQSGASLDVILRSFRTLYTVRKDLRRTTRDDLSGVVTGGAELGALQVTRPGS